MAFCLFDLCFVILTLILMCYINTFGKENVRAFKKF